MATVENLGGGKPLTFEAFEVPLNASIGDESLQGAFAKFRNRKKVGSLGYIIGLAC